MTARIGVLASGTGTNLEAILDSIAGGTLDASVELVVSNNPDAPALKKAARRGVQAICIDHRDYSSRERFDEAVAKALRRHAVEWVVLAGFMRILTSKMLDTFPRRILNIHPALLPSFPGLDAPSQALEAGVRVAGCTVHVVDEGTDTGPILAQAVVPVLFSDVVETLTARIQAQERRLYPRVIQLISEGRLEWLGDKPRISGLPSAAGCLVFPPLETERPSGEGELP